MELQFKKGLPKKEGHYIVRGFTGAMTNSYFDGTDFDIADVKEYSEYSQEKPIDVIKQFTHCDARVIHKRGICEFCDEHPDWQQLRQVWNINFTGEYDPNKTLCPSEKFRDLENINKWYGNRPHKEK